MFQSVIFTGILSKISVQGCHCFAA